MKSPRGHAARVTRRIILLRHAEAADRDADHPTDASRPLTPAGRAEAERVGRWLVEEGIVPSRVVASPAARARETAALAAAAAGLDPRDVEEDARAYGADAATLAALVHEHARPGATTLLVGHNPAIGMLRWALPGARPADEREAAFPPASAAAFELPEGGDPLGRARPLARRLPGR